MTLKICRNYLIDSIFNLESLFICLPYGLLQEGRIFFHEIVLLPLYRQQCNENSLYKSSWSHGMEDISCSWLVPSAKGMFFFHRISTNGGSEDILFCKILSKMKLCHWLSSIICWKQHIWHVGVTIVLTNAK